MKIKEQAIKELESLGPAEVIKIYETIISLKKGPKERKAKKGSLSYMKVRNALKKCKGSLSEDIILLRAERV